LVQAPDARLVREVGGDALQRALVAAEAPAPRVHLAHEMLEVHAAALAAAPRGEQVHQPGLAAADDAPEVDTAAGLRVLLPPPEDRLQAPPPRRRRRRGREAAVQCVQAPGHRPLRRVGHARLLAQRALVTFEETHQARALRTASERVSPVAGRRECRTDTSGWRVAKSAASCSTRYTERCWPPVQPTATVR